MAENIVVVYGSGASYASGYTVKISENAGTNSIDKSIAPPTDQTFFTEIPDDFLRRNYYSLWKFKKLYFGPDALVGMEEVWTAVDLNFKHITLDTYSWERETKEYGSEGMMRGERYPNMDINGPHHTQYGFDTSPTNNKYKFLGNVGRDLRRLIYDVYSSYEMTCDQDCFRSLHMSIKKSNHKISGYITFNYDCYLENSLNDQLFKYISANSNTALFETLVHGEIPIVKLHGSLSWEEKRDGILHKIIYHAPPYSKEVQVEPRYKDDLHWSQPAIIPPTIFKQEINDDARTANSMTQTILQQWSAAVTVLQKADRIIFVGYSFPATDFHSKRIFQIASMVRRNNGAQVIKVLYCTGPKDNAEEKKRLLKTIFGNTADVRIILGFDELLEGQDLREFLGA